MSVYLPSCSVQSLFYIRQTPSLLQFVSSLYANEMHYFISGKKDMLHRYCRNYIKKKKKEILKDSNNNKSTLENLQACSSSEQLFCFSTERGRERDEFTV